MFPSVDFRHLFVPEVLLNDEIIPIFDSKEKIRSYFDIGYLQAS